MAGSLLPSLFRLRTEELDPQFWIATAQGDVNVRAVQVPLVHWIVGAIRPRVLVELGSADSLSYAALCHAVERLALGTRCCAVTGRDDGAGAGCAGQALDDGSIDLLHLDGPLIDEAVRQAFETWLPKLSNRAVVLLHGIAGQHGDAGVRRSGTR